MAQGDTIRVELSNDTKYELGHNFRADGDLERLARWTLVGGFRRLLDGDP